MHDIAQKQIFFFKLPELDPDPDLVVNFPDPDPAKRSGSDRIRIRIQIRNTALVHPEQPNVGNVPTRGRHKKRYSVLAIMLRYVLEL
jgi:hypothetical protein